MNLSRASMQPLMPVIHVTPDDPRLELYRGVSDAALLNAHGLFVAEGRIVVRRVLETGYVLQSALMNGAALDALGATMQALAPDVPLYRCATADFQQITGFNIHRGCLALVHRPPSRSWGEAVGTTRLVVALERVANADNVGSVFRNAAAFGAGAVLLDPRCCDPLYRKAVRTSMGAVLQVPYARVESWLQMLAELRALGFILAALSPRAPLSLAAFAESTSHQRVALIVGTEGAGLDEATLQVVDARVGIPMRESVDSLNLAVATGIALARCAEAAIGRERH
jgi:tRNA G18 (ribose-2'-O)-methylase SpoU